MNNLLYDWHTHPYAHGEEEVQPCQNLNILKEFVERAKKVGLSGLGFSDHSFYLTEFNFDNLLRIKEEYQDIDIKIGIEFDYFPGKEEEIAKIISNYPFDYTIGSVHHIGDWNFDHPKYSHRFKERPLIDIYQDYYNLVTKAAKSGLFNIIGHLDLIKVFNHKLTNMTQQEKIIKPVLNAIANKDDLAIEINTNGINKPAKEFYPDDRILSLIGERDIPVVLSSDAHNSNRVGENFPQATNKLSEFKVEKSLVFTDLKGKKIKITD